MSIIQLPLPIAANTGVTPNIKTMTVTDDLATVTTLGYLNAGNLQGYTVDGNDVVHAKYNWNEQTQSGDDVVLNVSLVSGEVKLTEDISEGNVELPVTVDHIAVFADTNGKIKQDATTAINAGEIQSGVDGTEGKFRVFSDTASRGAFEIVTQANTNDSTCTLQSDQVSTDTTFHLTAPISTPDLYIQASDKPASVASDLIAFRVECDATTLLGGGSVSLISGRGIGTQFEVLELNISTESAGFSGGGGDRLGEIADLSGTVYSALSAADIQTVPNARWGDTALPFPASAGLSTLTGSNESLFFRWTGGTADYTAGNIIISGLAHQVA